MVGVHIPVAKASSYRQLYQYVRTPHFLYKGMTHFFPNPPETYAECRGENSPEAHDGGGESNCADVASPL